MIRKNHIKTAIALLLIIGTIFTLCSCGLINNEKETTTSQVLTQQTVTEAAVETETIAENGKTIIFPAGLKESQNKYSVISWANGTSAPTATYIPLLEELAKGGYIVISDDSTMTANGKSQIDSIDYIIKQNGNSSSVFYNKVDTKAIGVCGHSQGGRSCINAAQADKRIGCVVSIAGSSTADEARGLNTPSLFLTGTNDMIVPSDQWCQPSYDAVAGRAAYASLDEGIHTSCISAPKKFASYSIAWFDAYLRNDAEAKAVFKDGGKLANDGYWKDFQNKN